MGFAVAGRQDKGAEQDPAFDLATETGRPRAGGHGRVIVSPTAPTAAFPLGEKLDDPLRMYRSDVFTVGPSLAGLPALTVSTGRDRDGLPLSLQLTGPALGEETLFTLGAAVERARGFRAGGAA